MITRKAYGGAYDVMASKHLRADFNFAFPTAEIAVMGPDGAVNIIFRKELAEAEDPVARKAELVADYRAEFANPYKAAELGYIDAVIRPEDLRRRLATSFQLLGNMRHEKADKPEASECHKELAPDSRCDESLKCHGVLIRLNVRGL